ncbi:MAG TPA: nickel pincer cofactor biosynthesis protein LarB [Ktedonobacterales bacterium]|nr:nickel pincer cofactor biosynthesis protein LarB [Ktedonobacterales bacterium]
MSDDTSTHQHKRRVAPDKVAEADAGAQSSAALPPAGRASNGQGDVFAPIGEAAHLVARLDIGRAARKGIPEVVLADAKSDEQVIAIVRALLASSGCALVSRLRPATLDHLTHEFVETGAAVADVRRQAHAMALHAPGYVRPQTGGHIGVLTAGVSDIPVAEEARLVAEEMGCHVASLYDVGVAGLHRLLGPLQTLLTDGVAALVVCAGMDGALPSVVAGLSPVPVIGVPTSIGYGAGGKGHAALLAMLQTCSPGLTVVNIDNGVGAGATAALIANQIAAARSG